MVFSNTKKFFKNVLMHLNYMHIRNKLFFSYIIVFVGVILISYIILYSTLHRTINNQIESELTTTTNTIITLVETAADISVKNHLRAIAEMNMNIAEYYYKKSLNGEISTAQAKQIVKEIFLSQSIGKTGYIYCLSSSGVVLVHPIKELRGKNLTEYQFVREQLLMREGYLEYKWKNPEDTEPRPKSVYMNYFKEWGWIISVSSYRDEFKDLININDFRDSILAIKFGETGYPFILDSNGNLIIHPKVKLRNFIDTKDEYGFEFIREICNNKKGKIVYYWKNPDEKIARKKITIYNYIPRLDWIIASSSYSEEYNAPIRAIDYLLLTLGIIAILLIFLIALWISNSITNSLKTVIHGFSEAEKGDLSIRMPVEGNNEISELTHYFNNFISSLETEKHNLLVAEQATKRSEKKYRDIFNNAREGLFQTTLEGKVISVNISLARILGYSSEKEVIENYYDLATQLYVSPNRRNELLVLINEKKEVTDFEIECYNKNKEIFWASMNARLISDNNESYIEGSFIDITKRRFIENEMKKSKEQCELRVEERTVRLSRLVEELEKQNQQIAMLSEMGNLLHLAETNDEAYKIISLYMHKIFNRPGALYIQSEDDNTLVLAAKWNNINTRETLSKDQCWALRQGKMSITTDSNDNPICQHMSTIPEGGYICTPMIAHGKVLGLLHLNKIVTNIDNPYDNSREVKLMTKMVQAITEEIALALSNLCLRQKLKDQSIHDALTELYNRRFMNEALSKEVSKAFRHKYSFGVIMSDIDFFKQFNDTYGHIAGDELLKEIGLLFKNTIRHEDIACRFGGEEFLIILPNISKPDLLKKANDLLSGVPSIQLGSNITRKVTISIGVAIFPDNAKTGEEIIIAADKALYQAKSNGRNCIVMAG